MNSTINSEDSPAMITWELNYKFAYLPTTKEDIKLLIDLAAGIHYAMFKTLDDTRDELTMEIVAMSATYN